MTCAVKIGRDARRQLPSDGLSLSNTANRANSTPMGSSLADCILVPLPRVSDSRGCLSFVEGGRHIPFHVARLFYMYGMARDTIRGGHAHRECAQFLIAQEGEFSIELNDGTSTQSLLLRHPHEGLYIPPGIWVTLKSLSERGVVTALASAPYVESDYLRDFGGFLEWKRAQSEPIHLSNDRIVVRPYRNPDAAAFSRSAIESAPEAGRWLKWCTPEYDEQRAARYIREAELDRIGKQAFSFGIFEAGSGGNHLGGVSLNRLDWTSRSANLGYWVATRASGRGVGTQAAALMCRFGFEQLGLARIEILVEVGNKPSRAVAVRIGAKPEGILRNRIAQGDAHVDAELFSLLPGDIARGSL